MPDPLTPNIQLSVPTRGADVGTWDVPVNGDMSILDACFGSIVTITLSNVNVTLTVNQCQNAVIRLIGTLTGNVDIVTPNINKFFIFDNLTTGNFYVRITPPGTTAIACPPQGSQSLIFVNGTEAKFGNMPPVGTFLDFAGTTVPSWISVSSPQPYLLCNGGGFSGGTYPILAAILAGTTLPDFRGRAPYFLNGGTNRLTSAGAGIDGDTFLAAGGNNGLTLAANQIPSLTSSGNNSISVSSSDAVPKNYATNTVGTPGTGTPVAFPVGNNIGQIASSGTNGITVAYTNGGLQGINNAAPGLVSGIRLIRAG